MRDRKRWRCSSFERWRNILTIRVPFVMQVPLQIDN